MIERNINKQVIYLGGITCCGKTSIGKLITKLSADSVVLNSSKELMKYLKLKTYNDLDKVPDNIQKRARTFVYLDFINTSKRRNIIIDGHYLLFGRNIRPTSCIDIQWSKFMTIYLFIFVNPKIILKRLIKDKKSLSRRLKNLSYSKNNLLVKIRQSQILSLREAKKVTKSLNKPLIIISNDDKLDKSVDEIKDIIKFSYSRFYYQK